MEQLLGALTVVFALGVTLPQARVSLLQRRWHGLAFAMVANSALSSLAWIAYGVVDGDPWLVITSALSAAFHGAIAIAVVARARARRRWPIGTGVVVGWAVVLGVAVAAWPWTTVPLVVALTGGVWASTLPQVKAAWRAPATDGISVTSWAVFGADASVWLAYGLVAGSLAPVTWGISALVLAAAIVVGVLRSRRRAAVAVATGA
jgi:uncharacterized protein with PQ loop repeat